MDYANFRHRDVAHDARRQLDHVRAVATKVTASQGDHGTDPDLAALAERLDEMDVNEFGRLSATLVRRVGNSIDRRALLKLAAGLSLAAVAPAISTFEAGAAQSDAPSAGVDRLAGVWHSRYVFLQLRSSKRISGGALRCAQPAG